MRFWIRLAVVALPGLALLVPIALEASTKNDELKLSLKASREKTPVGETATLQLRLKNRTGETRDVTVELSYKDATEPYAVETVTLGPKEKVKLDVDCPVPADFIGKKLRAYARVEGLEDRAKVKVKLGDITNEQWLRGRDLYQSLCKRCHGKKGGEVRGDSLDRWISSMQKGPDSMPRYPSTSVADIILMREFVKDPDREVVEPPPGDATYDGGIATLLGASCVSCHTEGNARGGVRLETYEEAFANRASSLDTIERGTMPPGSPLGTDDEALFRAWVDAGAPR